MSDSLALLEQALELGRQELERLETGEVDELHEMALERSRLIDQAWNGRDHSRERELRDKLIQLRDLQGELSAEAQRLHASLRDKLKSTKQQSTRFHGYAKAAKPRPVTNRFLSAKG